MEDMDSCIIDAVVNTDLSITTSALARKGTFGIFLKVNGFFVSFRILRGRSWMRTYECE